MRMKKIFAVLLAMVMVVAVAAGCSKQSANKTGGNSGNGSDLYQEVSVKIDSATEDIKGEFKVSTGISGEKTNISVTADIKDDSGNKFNINSDNFMVVTGDKVYINVKNILDAAAGIDEINDSLSQIKDMFSKDFVYFEIKDIGKLMTASVDSGFILELVDSLIAAYDDISSKDGDKVVISIESAEDISKFLNDTAEFISANADKIADKVESEMNSINIQDVFEGIVDSVVDSMADMYKEMGIEVTDDQIKALKDEMLSAYDIEDYMVSKSDVKDAFDEIVTELKAAAEDTDSYGDNDLLSEASIKLEITKSDKACSVSAVISSDNDKVEISTSINTAASVSVSEPKNAENFMDLISNLMSILSN